MTATEAYELTTKGGAPDFALVIGFCEAAGPYCLIGGLAVNCYVEPIYTLDIDIVVTSPHLCAVTAQLEQQGFSIETHPNPINAQSAGSQLRIQFTIDERYQSFPSRAERHEIFRVLTQVASLKDVVQGKLWSYSDPNRRPSKRKKDELDLIRLAEAHPELRSLYPNALLDQIKQI